MMPTQDERDEAHAASNERWLNRLGEPLNSTRGPVDSDEREADLLRAAISRAPTPVPMSDAQYQALRGRRDDVLRERLMAAAHAEGLIGPRRLTSWSWPSAVGLAAALLLVVALFERPSGIQTYPVEPVLRGDSNDVETVLDDRPRVRAESLAAELRQAGAPVSLYQQGNIYTLDIVVVPENAPAITQVLKSQGLDAPHRSVRVRIKPH